MTAPANFDRVARGYRALELAVFGHELERTRFAFADRLAGCRSVLVLGEGDGRFVARLLHAAPAARIHCIDASAAMLAQARSRIGVDQLGRVQFEQADAATMPLPPSAYDAVVTLFFLDCFAEWEVQRLVQRVAAALLPGAWWLYADFAVPAEPWLRLRARAWLALLYGFFAVATGLRVRRLPGAEEAIRRSGFVPAAVQSRQGGLLRTVLFRRG